MKRIILSAVMLLGMAFSAQSQKLMSKNAIGIRVGDNDGPAAAVSYQRAILTNNRLEFDLGVKNNNHFDAVKLAGVFQWVWKIDGGLNWYAGAGGGFGHYNYDHKYYYYEDYPYGYKHDDSGAFAFLAGDIGLEYHFDIPLMISLDVRPEIGSDRYYEDNIGADIGISARYKF